MDKTSQSFKSRLGAKASESSANSAVSDSSDYSSPFGDCCPSGQGAMTIADFEAHAAKAGQFQPDAKTIKTRKAKTSRRSSKAKASSSAPTASATGPLSSSATAYASNSASASYVDEAPWAGSSHTASSYYENAPDYVDALVPYEAYASHGGSSSQDSYDGIPWDDGLPPIEAYGGAAAPRADYQEERITMSSSHRNKHMDDRSFAAMGDLFGSSSDDSAPRYESAQSPSFGYGAGASAGSAQSRSATVGAGMSASSDDLAPWDESIPDAFAGRRGTAVAGSTTASAKKTKGSSSRAAKGKGPVSVREALHDPVLMTNAFESTPSREAAAKGHQGARDYVDAMTSVIDEYTGVADRYGLKRPAAIRDYADAESAAVASTTAATTATAADTGAVSSQTMKRGDVSVSGGDGEATEIFDPENNISVKTSSTSSKKDIATMSDDDFLSALAFGGADIFEDDDSSESYTPDVPSNSSQASKSKASSVSSQAAGGYAAVAATAAASSDSEYAFKPRASDSNSMRHQAFDALFGGGAQEGAGSYSGAGSDSDEDIEATADEVYSQNYGYDETEDEESDEASATVSAYSARSAGAGAMQAVDSYDEDSEEIKQALREDDAPVAKRTSKMPKINIASKTSSACGAGAAEAAAGAAAAVLDDGDYDESFTLRDRQRKSLEILSHRGIIMTDHYYDDYVSKMRQAHMKPFARDVLLKMNVVRVFGKKGVLASKLPGYSPREGQQKFADGVAEAITTHKFLAVEAGTGTGKTFAYLVPPLLAGKTVMVSTKTKALQDQLISKDVPNLFKMLGTKHLHAISLKGHSNYICRYLFDGDGMRNLPARDRQRISEYIDQCTDSLDSNPKTAKFGEMKFSLKEGARSFVCCDSFLCQEMSSTCPYAKAKRELLKEIAENSNVGASVVSPEDAMIETGRVFGPGAAAQAPAIGYKRARSGSTGIDGSHCFVFAARQEAKERDAVIINHSLFYAALQSPNGIGNPNSILPLPDVLIFDEAHTLAEVGREFFKRDNNLNNIKDLVTEVHKVFSGSAVATSSGKFLEVLCKIERIAEILIRAFSLRGEGKHGVANFKYCHRHFKSPFELLRYELFNENDRKLLGTDSYTMQEVRALLQAEGLTEQGWFEKGLGELDFGGIKITTEEINSNSEGSSSSDSFDSALARSKRTASDREFNSSLVRRFAQLCSQYGVDYKQISAFASDMDDVMTDYNGQPVRNSLFRTLMGDLLFAMKSLSNLLESNKEAAEDVNPLITSVNGLVDFITDFMNSDRNKQGEVKWDNAAWVEVVPNDKEGYNFIMTVCPIDIGPYLSTALRKIQEQGCSVVFTSATITTGQKFDKFIYDIGLSTDEVTQRIVPSPFDYTNNACLFTSPSFPAMMTKDRMAKSLKMLEAIIDATEGGIFILTTSYSALKEAYEYMDQHYSSKRLILKQGGNLAETMKSFVDHGSAVLIGTSSFWEGVDVPGKALSLVIIDKMPFKQVGDPITKAIEGKLKSKGRNFFTDESLPSAIIALRQGAGRLIRNESDTGALVLLDPRVHEKGYGKTVFESLPPMTRVTSVSEVLNFLKRFK